VPVLTVDEIEAMQKQAYDEAFAQVKKMALAKVLMKVQNKAIRKMCRCCKKRRTEFVSLLESLSPTV